ncbi:MAG: hypothetical protein ACYDHY_18165 [Acidiferrobacterales bacterium]
MTIKKVEIINIRDITASPRCIKRGTGKQVRAAILEAVGEGRYPQLSFAGLEDISMAFASGMLNGLPPAIIQLMQPPLHASTRTIELLRWASQHLELGDSWVLGNSGSGGNQEFHPLLDGSYPNVA